MRMQGLAFATAGLALWASAGTGDAQAASPGKGVQVAQAPFRVAQAAQTGRRSGGIGDFGSANNNKPVNVEADKLEVFQKDGRAVYTGNVIAVQGDTTMKCTQLVVFFDQSKTGAPGAAPAPQAGAGGQGEALKKLECKGPVSVVAKSEGKTQVATGNNAVYDRVAGLVTLRGNVTLADGPKNLTKCETFTYNTNSSQAICAGGGAGGRVSGVFETGGDEKPAAATPAGKPKTN